MTTDDQVQTAERVIAAAPAIARIDAIDVRLLEIEAARRQVKTGLPPKAEMSDRLVAELDRIRVGFEQVGGGYDSNLNALDVLRRLLRDHGTRRIEVANAQQLLGLFVWLLGPSLDASARAAVKRLTFVEGLSTEERRARTAELMAERDALLVEREALVEEALSLSGGAVSVRHLPETQAKRDVEAARAREEEAARQRQADAAVDINRRYQNDEQHVRRSSYIESGGEVR